MSSSNVIANTSTSHNIKTEYLTGVIERITFHAEDTGYTVPRMQVKGFKDLVTIIVFLIFKQGKTFNYKAVGITIPNMVNSLMLVNTTNRSSRSKAGYETHYFKFNSA
ncbi:hypothetical protein VB715_21050 [Crocosphaera sp. UHCC 0190]|uniref:YrrC family ATP-dependent DNA helicase n=1 Tax=Crocosphaera sp. UHCC 0190 TaxID=3110246 RepID=UPI002B20C54E|nr:hypothetical protein [Crocosphaera sp. UHCC 0190]MEA5512263.1 hypothetical protein [Crocosphaera sp. UHCC 0190]